MEGQFVKNWVPQGQFVKNWVSQGQFVKNLRGKTFCSIFSGERVFYKIVLLYHGKSERQQSRQQI
jgi:hypothetical protein